MITITIDGVKPEPQARPRLGKFGSVYSPKTEFYRAVFVHARAKKPAIPLDGPLFVRADFRFPRPASVKSTQLLKWTRPDIDNALKSAFDAITEAGVWLDDGRVSKVKATKKYDDIPGVTIKIVQMADPHWKKAAA